MRVTLREIQRKKGAGERIAVATACDRPSVAPAERAFVPTILVGDPPGRVVCGQRATPPVSLDESALKADLDEVRSGAFPMPAQRSTMDAAALDGVA